MRCAVVFSAARAFADRTRRRKALRVAHVLFTEDSADRIGETRFAATTAADHEVSEATAFTGPIAEHRAKVLVGAVDVRRKRRHKGLTTFALGDPSTRLVHEHTRTQSGPSDAGNEIPVYPVAFRQASSARCAVGRVAE
jgi:hypothetical protein